MIIVKIGDGMGNQLFNYACGYAAARRENDTLKLDTSEADNSTLRDFELDKFHLKYDARESFPKNLQTSAERFQVPRHQGAGSACGGSESLPEKEIPQQIPARLLAAYGLF